MKRLKIIKLLIVVLFSVEVDAEERTNLNKLNRDDQIIALSWLNNSCGVGEQKGFEKKINAKGNAFVPVFWEAYQQGPTEQEKQIIRDTAKSNYMERMKWLREFGNLQLGEEETNKQLAVTEKQYVELILNKHTNGYKTAAVSGVGLIGTDQSVIELKIIANDPKNPVQSAAQEAQKKLLLKPPVSREQP
jgi:hypothetical protein